MAKVVERCCKNCQRSVEKSRTTKYKKYDVSVRDCGAYWYGWFVVVITNVPVAVSELCLACNKLSQGVSS